MAELKQIDKITTESSECIPTGISELDRVLGGGVYPGALILVGGSPGIGKSTLILQAAFMLANKGKKILYISAEESDTQIAQRAVRLHLNSDNFYILSETSLDQIMYQVEKVSPDCLVIDSIQTIYTDTFTSGPGSVGQVRECTVRLMQASKKKNMSIFIIGHVTKDGTIAGPRVLEHMVDTVLYFEGDSHSFYRMLRGVKNRFGSVHELGIFEMTEAGLKIVDNPASIFLKERGLDAPGSVLTVTLEGTRPLVIEIQGLVTPSYYGVPRRVTTGVDYNRVSMLIAVLEKRAGLNISNSDAFVNCVGGLKINETAIDLAICLALATSYRDKPLEKNTVAIGEVGLSGEIRSVPRVTERLAEIEKLGFNNIILPAGNAKEFERVKKNKLELFTVKNIRDALNVIS